MSDYEVRVTGRAERDLRDILDAPSDNYTPIQQLAYVDAILVDCAKLDFWPKRFSAVYISGREYRRFRYKAHTIFYRVQEEQKIVLVDAVLHGRMDFKRRL